MSPGEGKTEAQKAWALRGNKTRVTCGGGELALSYKDTAPTLLVVVPSTTGQRSSQCWSGRIKSGNVKSSSVD